MGLVLPNKLLLPPGVGEHFAIILWLWILDTPVVQFQRITGRYTVRCGSAMPDKQDIDQQLELLQIHRQTLHLYLKQMAMMGGTSYSSPPIIHGIREARAGIERIKQILRTWKVRVEDHPDDEEVERECVFSGNLLGGEVNTTIEHSNSYNGDKLKAYKELFNMNSWDLGCHTGRPARFSASLAGLSTVILAGIAMG